MGGFRMENEENNMDFLDLDDDTPVETLPETTPFAAPRPRKPWLLMGLAVVVILLATYIIVRTIGGDSPKSVEINLDAPAIVAEPEPVAVPVPAPNDTLNVPPRPMPVPQPMPQPVAQPQPMPQPAPQPVVESNGVPVRVISDRREVTFNPDQAPQPAPQPAAKPAPQPVAQPQPTAAPAPKPAAKPAAKSAPKVATQPSGKWFVQFGSYATRAAAESAERQMRAGHKSLFDGKQFVILAAQINGKTTYRLRVTFATSSDANGFCQNAKSDGLDCYVAK